MPQTRRVSLAITAVVLTMVLGYTAELRLRATTVSDCVGQPYGTAGCPTRPVSSTLASSSSVHNRCGNAIWDEGEECDRGRFNGKTDCSETCKTLKCGDGVITRDIGEECEPETEEVYVLDESGNLTTEVQFVDSAQCGWFCKPPTCDSDGVCRDGCDLKYTGACAGTGVTLTAETDVEESSEESSAEAAPAAASSVSSGPPPVCGNSMIESPEECDDGNKIGVDACSNECRKTRCGDGVQQVGEECDDGNPDNTDGCSTACKRTGCGNGILEIELREECDDANKVSDDTCTNSCILPRCGDGIKHKGEQCDEGTRNSDTQQNFCRTNCELPHCGDGVIDAGEQCDASGRNSDTDPNACRKNCRNAFCGDGIIDLGEECDDKNKTDADACNNTCKKAICGDGVVQSGEECDWGIKNDNAVSDSCRTSCKLPRCGDGVTDKGEACDGSMGCSPTCTVAATEQSSSVSPQEDQADAPQSLSLPVVVGGGALTVLVLMSILFRSLLTRLFHKGGVPKGTDIDDIPLDQIEMPWHKW